jgi:hypothetical protein
MANKRLLKWIIGSIAVLAVIVIGVVAALVLPERSKFGKVKDEAMEAGRMANSFAAADEDYFHDMDGGYKLDKPLSANAIRGRNTWIVWAGGNDRFWDFMANNTFGAFDLLKTLSSHPKLYANRDNRWYYLGLVNEPCFEKATSPDPDRWGLWLDKRVEGANCPPDPFANAEKYPGVKIGARGTTVPVGSFYGEPSGIVGLRLFPNPDFDAEAAAKWDAEKFYNDPNYYQDKNLVRPYRVGMSCAFCHVGPSPTNPPPDPENPEWQHLNSNPGAQYYWVDRIFFWNTKNREKPGEPAPNERNFIYQLFHTNPPGTLDTSLVSTDYINNPRTMNAVYNVGARLQPALRWGKEILSGDELANKQFNDFPQTQQLGQFWNPLHNTVRTARVLKDGADAVGVLGALNRVYLNIGLFSEEWLLHFRPVIGGRKITPIRIEDATRNSAYWNVTVNQTPDMAVFFLETAKPDKLADALGGHQYLTDDETVLTHGKIVFGENCAVCHSSKIPKAPPAKEIDVGECDGGGNGAQYLKCWNRYWEWAQTGEFKKKMREMVLAPDFLDNNFLSTERRIPVTLLETNLCSPLATNALENDIWDNFSSRSYKDLPSVGSVKIHHPLTGKKSTYQMPAGGRGYTRPASLISLWSQAPFLLNNSVGTYYNYTRSEQYYTKGPYKKMDYEKDNSYPVHSLFEARIRSFNDSIEKMLWPEKRKKDIDVIRELGLPESEAVNVPGYIYRTTAASCLKIPAGYLPELLQQVAGHSWLQRKLPWVFGEGGDLELGPIPKGTPVSLLSNIQLIAEGNESAVKHAKKLLDLLIPLIKDLKAIGGGCSEADLRDEEKLERARQIFLQNDVVDKLVELSKCPDYVVNRGHYFGAELPDKDKLDLIEFLKTF